MNMKKPEEIKTHPTFESLFPIKPAVLAKIEQDMSDGTYDLSQPIILAIWEGLEEQVCIDGHTRLQAALNTGIEEVPVWLHEFDTEEEALEKAIQLQSNRRNMTDAELVTCIETLDKRKPRGGDRRSEEAKSKASSDAIEKSGSKSAADTAKLLGISTSKVERTRSVLSNGDPETIEAVKNNEMSINKACQKTRKERSKQKKTNKTKPNSSTENSKQEAIDVCQERQQEDTGTEVDETAPVVISIEHYKALFELGGISVQEHVGRAVDRYLYMLTLGQENEEAKEEDWDEDEVAKNNDNKCGLDGIAAEESNHGHSEDEDEEEYFDPDTYEG